jgi:excisionase family DNA binding protein
MDVLLISQKQAAEILGVSLRKVASLISEGELPSRKIGKRRLVPVQELRKFALGPYEASSPRPGPAGE